MVLVCVTALFAGCSGTSDVPDEVLGEWASESQTLVSVFVGRGHEHCGTQDLADLELQDTAAGTRTHYLRDPRGSMKRFTTLAPSDDFTTLEALPVGVVPTGFEREGAALWLEADGSAAYLVLEDTIERWPRWQSSLGNCD